MPLSASGAGVAGSPADHRGAAAVGGDPPLLVEMHEVASMAVWRDAWADLAGRALEPNPFMAPTFALHLAERLPTRRQPRFVAVWAVAGSGERALVALCAVARPSPLGLAAWVWQHEFMALGLPLLDRDRAVPALKAALAWIGRAYPRRSALGLMTVPADGPTMQALSDTAAGTGRPIRLMDPRRRALLIHGPGLPPPGLAALTPTRRSKLQRQRRRFGRGLALTSAGPENLEAIAEALERFLVLEAAGWKGRRRTALGCDPMTADFARALAVGMGHDGRIRIDSLEGADGPVAMAVILRSGDRDFVWKIAYDETVGALSPGVQLILALTERHMALGESGAIDSCALPDHPMIDRLWPSRLPIVDVMLGLSPTRRPAFDTAVTAEIWRRRGRETAKAALAALRARLHRKAAASRATTAPSESMA